MFDVLGRQVATLINQPMKAGTHTVSFDAQRLASDIYRLKLVASVLPAMLLIK